jgi:peptidoglycan/xylan/chitin deacetylase (PgdA/CDA1 family)
MSSRFQPVVLCYHAVSERWTHHLAVTPQTLDRQLRFLQARGYRSVRASGVVAGHGRRLHVTFDDAFRSIRAALPVLDRHGVFATVFVCTALADTGSQFPATSIPGRTSPDDLATLDWSAVRELAEQGHEIGSHSASHVHLTHVSDAELKRELRGSRERLEAELGRTCRYLAYPYGDHDERVRAAARRAGFEAAFALPGRLHPIDPFALPRVGVSRRDGVVRFTLKTAPTRRLLARMLKWS